MGCCSSKQSDSNITNYIESLKTHYQDYMTKKEATGLLRLKTNYHRSNYNYKNLKYLEVKKKLTKSVIASMVPTFQSVSFKLKDSNFLPKALNIDLKEMNSHLNSPENSFQKEMKLEKSKVMQLKLKLVDLNNSLIGLKNKFERNLNILKEVVYSKRRSWHKRSLTDKCEDSTFYNTSNSYGLASERSYLIERSLVKNIENLKCVSRLSPLLIELKSKWLLRDEIKKNIENVSRNYEEKLRKIDELQNKIEFEPIDMILDGRYTEAELKMLKSKINVLEVEIDYEKKEKVFLKSIYDIDQKLHKFESKKMFEVQEV